MKKRCVVRNEPIYGYGLDMFVALLVLSTFVLTLLVDTLPNLHTDTEDRNEFECCDKVLKSNRQFQDILSCMYGDSFKQELYVLSDTPPFAVQVYCSTGEIIEY